MLVSLTGAGDLARVVEAEPVHLSEAEGQGLEVRWPEWELLALELAAHDQHVVIEDVELVQQRQVGLGDVRHEQGGIVGQERVAARAGLLPVRVLFVS